MSIEPTVLTDNSREDDAARAVGLVHVGEMRSQPKGNTFLPVLLRLSLQLPAFTSLHKSGSNRSFFVGSIARTRNSVE